MKLNKKKIAVISLILCICAIISLGSLAWFTDSDTVDNTLQFVTDFQMDLYETDGAGNIVYNKTGKETIGQTYKNVMPGDELHKDPTVINKSSTESQYIRMSVTVDNATSWATLITAGSDLSSIFTGFSSVDWTRYDAPTTDGTANTITYVFYLNQPLAAGNTATLFTGIKVPETLTDAAAKAMEESHITIKADAIQASNLGTVANTKAAFTKVEG